MISGWLVGGPLSRMKIEVWHVKPTLMQNIMWKRRVL